jgi:hypothetical protein
MLFICSTSLLGIDSITGIWKKEIKQGSSTGEANKNKIYPYQRREQDS